MVGFATLRAIGMRLRDEVRNSAASMLISQLPIPSHPVVPEAVRLRPTLALDN